MGANTRDMWCRHRTPFDPEKHPVCKAGIDYNKAFEVTDGNGAVLQRYDMDTMPCLGNCTERCDSYAMWTSAEIELREFALFGQIERIGKARAAIVAAHEATGAFAGEIACPCCGNGTLQWSKARSNGHVHAACSTPGCVSFRE